MEIFGQSLDLPAIASAAGLGGGAVGVITAGILFKGFIMRFLAQMVTTTVMTGIGFWALLNFLGYEIVPNAEVEQKISMSSVTGIFTPQSGLDDSESAMFSTQSAMTPEQMQFAENVAEAKASGKKIIYMKRNPN